MGDRADKKLESKKVVDVDNNALRKQNQMFPFEDYRPNSAMQRSLKTGMISRAEVIQKYIYIGNPLIRPAHKKQVRAALRLESGLLTIFEKWVRDSHQTRKYQSVEELIAAIRTSGSATGPRLDSPVVHTPQPVSSVEATASTSSSEAVTATSTTDAIEAATTQAPTSPMPSSLPMQSESHTRVGFEIEPGVHYSYGIIHQASLERLTNQTLATYYENGVALLEFLLDDIQRSGRTVHAQSEFRSLPLDFNAYTSSLHEIVRRAIGSFRMRTVMGITESTEPESHTGWLPSALMRANPFLPEGTGGGPMNSMSTVQHATLSIEIEAYCRLPDAQQEVLFPTGRGARNKNQLLEQIATRIRESRSGGYMDASAGARTRQVATVKSPIESIMAADPSLELPNIGDASSVRVDGSSRYHYPLVNVQDGVDEIRRTGRFPQIQGEGSSPRGYHAIAEKFQPPLIDSVSGELRLLVEHRTTTVGTLVDALRRIINPSRGTSPVRSSLRPFEVAARTMDSTRLGSLSHRTNDVSYADRLRASRLAGLVSLLPESSGAESETIETSSSDSQTRVVVVESPPYTAPPDQPLSLAALAAHYAVGIGWANERGSFSAEFALLRDNLGASLTTLRMGGLDNTVCERIHAVLPVLIANNAAARIGHPTAEVQEYIFDQLDILHGRTLWALLRYFRALGL